MSRIIKAVGICSIAAASILPGCDTTKHVRKADDRLPHAEHYSIGPKPYIQAEDRDESMWRRAYGK